MPREQDDEDDDGFGAITREDLANWALETGQPLWSPPRSVPTILPSEDSDASSDDMSDNALRTWLMDRGWSSSDGENDTETDVEHRTGVRQETDFDCVLLSPEICLPNVPWIPESKQIVTTEPHQEVWDDGLSPYPLYSFYHKKSRLRHWSASAMPGDGFICIVIPSENHIRGGDPRFNLQGGVCKTCIDFVQSHSWVKWQAYFESQNYEPPSRRGKPGRSQVLPCT